MCGAGIKHDLGIVRVREDGEVFRGVIWDGAEEKGAGGDGVPFYKEGQRNINLNNKLRGSLSVNL